MEKRIRPALMRSLYFDAVTFLRSIWAYLFVIAFFIIFWRATDTISPMYATMVFGMAISMAFALQRYTLFYKQTVGFSLTRRSFFLGGLLIKPVYMLFCTVLTLIGCLLDRSYAIGWMLLIAAMGGLLSASYGELAGAMVLRWNRMGLVLYMVLFVVFFMVMSGAYGTFLLRAIVSDTVPDYAAIAASVGIASLIGSPLAHLLAWLLMRGTEVRS